ncbi:unnamed protein product [Orchesella dallaii]|uniref:Uncharacterized protein n=1 Tax=Orchesella dallaii TaxID=48710 RepID=A0ABP1RBS9_9HEXA
MSDNMGSSTSSLEQSMLNVFDNHLLLELILGNVVSPQPHGNRVVSLGSNEGRSNSDVSNCRLVSKAWMDTIAKLFRLNEQPLFHLRLVHTDVLHMMDSTRFPIEGTLSKFITSVAHWEGEVPSGTYPRFELELCPTFFHMANEHVYRNLFDFFLKYGTYRMVRFNFSFHHTRFQYIPLSFPDFQFHNLREVVLIVDRVSLAFIPFIQQMLASSLSLETLEISGSSCQMSTTVACLAPVIDTIARKTPYIFKLPKTIKKIALYGTIETCSCFYQIPMNDLENLTEFTMSASPCLYSQMEQFLNTLAGQLKSLNFIGFTSCVFSFQRMYHLQFPAMKNLKTLTMNMPWDFMSLSSQIDYDVIFTNLKELNIVNLQLELLGCFLGGNKCATLEKLTAVAVIPFVHSEHGHRTTCPKMEATNLDMVIGIRASFVNLTHLEIGISGTYTPAMKGIFTDITNLKALTLYIDTGVRFKTFIDWDAIFTGLSVTTCESMRKYIQFGNYEEVGTMMVQPKFPSIANLESLEALYLVETSYPGCRPFDNRRSAARSNTGHHLCNFNVDNLPETPRAFSSLSFQFAFFAMPKLKTLFCTKGFMPNQEIQKKWTEKKGTSIKTLRSPKLFHLLTNKFSVFDKSWLC